MSGSSPSDPKWWAQELRGLLGSLGVGLKDLAKEFKLLYQAFQAYVYVLVAEALRERGVQLNAENVENGVFVFKLGTRAKEYECSYFSFDYNGNHYTLLFNIDVDVDLSGILNLDVAIARGPLTSSKYREDIVFFAECKSVNHGTMEYLACCIGQRFLVKRDLYGGRSHGFIDVVDVLAIRGDISVRMYNFYRNARDLGWKHLVKPIGWITPHNRGETS